MPDFCDNAFIISGETAHLEKILNILNTLTVEEPVFRALVGSPAENSEDAMISYYGTKWDIQKKALDYEHNAEYGIIGNMQTVYAPATGFYQKLSAQFTVNVNVEYESVNDDVKGKLIYENGVLLQQNEYRYMEGMYYMDTSVAKDDFWYEVEIKIEDEYRDAYDNANAAIKSELLFLNDEEKTRFRKMF